MRYLYSVIVFLLLPIIFFKLWRGGKNIPSAQNRWQERIGILPKNIFKNSTSTKNNLKTKPTIWIHTASVGEFIAARPLIDHYIKTQKWALCITTMTATGSAEVLKHYRGKVAHVYAPCDLGIFIRYFLKKIQPSAYLIIETELWPNTIHHCKKNKIPVIVVNARLSEKSANGYNTFSKFSAKMLSDVTHIIAQDIKDAQRFYALGLTKKKCSISGSIKFDLEISTKIQQQALRLKSALSEDGKYLILIAASTHQGEDESILDAFRALQKKHSNVRLILVPRHPERFQTVFDLCKKMDFTISKRSSQDKHDNNIANGLTHTEPFAKDTEILLGDTMGELLIMLGAADIAFIGGSFINNGGHNYIEAAAWGIPIVSGPSRFNFQHISDLLIAEGALSITETPKELCSEWDTLIADNALRVSRGLASKNIANNNRGALEKTIRTIDTIIHPYHSPFE